MRRKTGRRNELNPLILVLAVLAVLGLVIGGVVLLKKTAPQEPTAPGETLMTVTLPTGETAPGETEPPVTEPASQEPPETEPAPETTPATPGPTVEPSHQAIAVVGWALSDIRPDGFHYAHLTDRDRAALAEAVMTLASQDRLGFSVTLTGTDDPDQVMLPEEELNAALSSLVKGCALTEDVSYGTLRRIGSGWAAVPHKEPVTLPETRVISRADGVMTVVLVQDTGRGETVLQTAEVETESVEGGLGTCVLSWITHDVPRYSRSDGEGRVTMTGIPATVAAVEITWAADTDKALLRVGDTAVEVLGGKAGQSQVICLPAAMETETLTLEADPAAVQSIAIY